MICSWALWLLVGPVAAESLQQPLFAHNQRQWDTRDPFNDEFDNLVEKVLKQFHVPSVTVSVVVGNNTFAKGYGHAVFPDLKATPETLYYAASTTKSFTAASLLMLMEETANSSSPLRLTDKISSLIRDDFVLPDSYATEHATLEDAMSHVTGMPGHDLSYGGSGFKLRDYVRNLRHLPMTAELRSKFQYCNMMYGTLSYIIETITGTWLGDFFRTKIWEPLSMNSTFLSLEDARKAKGATMARGYFWNNHTKKFVPESFLDTRLLSGAGGVITNVLDYAKYMRAMLEMPPILSEESYRQLRTARSFMDPHTEAPYTGPQAYGLGWAITTYRDAQIFYHNGGLSGYGSLMGYMPSRNWGVALLANTEMTSNVVIMVLTFALMDDLLETPEEERFDWIKKYSEAFERRKDNLEKSRERLYPDAPRKEKAIPPSLPLAAYTGTYSHPAYHNITLTLKSFETDDKRRFDEEIRLHANVFDKVWQHVLDFEHVNGEYFIAHCGPNPAALTMIPVDNIPAEFRIGPDSKVSELGIAYEGAMNGEKIWFSKLKAT